MIRLPNVELLVLVTVRLLSAFMVAPIIGHRSVPAVAKIIDRPGGFPGLAVGRSGRHDG